MKSSIKLALVAALAIEAVNFRFVCVPVDVGLPDDARWYQTALAFQWVGVHYVGLHFTNWTEGLGLQRFSPSLWFVSGYVETAMLFVFGVLAFRWLRAVLQRKRTRTA